MNKKLRSIKTSKKLHFIMTHAHLQYVKILSLAIRAKSVSKKKTSHSENKFHTPLHVKYDVFESYAN